MPYDVEEILKAAWLKSNIFTRTLVRVTAYSVAVTAYPVILVKHILKKK
jgi:hypothetical protein